MALNITMVSPMANLLGASWLMPFILPSTSSSAVAPARNAAMAESDAGVPDRVVAATVMSAGGVIIGAVVSLYSETVTVAVAVAALPERSLAENVTVVLPTGNVVGASWPITPISPSMSSTALAEPRNSAIIVSVAGVPSGLVAMTKMSAGGVMFGAVVSIYSETVTLAVAVPVLPALSPAVKVTSVVPMGKRAGALLSTGEMAPSTSSVAVAAFRKSAITASVAGVPDASVADTVMSVGGVTVGAALST